MLKHEQMYATSLSLTEATLIKAQPRRRHASESNPSEILKILGLAPHASPFLPASNTSALMTKGSFVTS